MSLPQKPYLPSLLPFENTRVFTFFIPPKPRSMAYPVNEIEALEATETFTPVVIRI